MAVGLGSMRWCAVQQAPLMRSSRVHPGARGRARGATRVWVGAAGLAAAAILAPVAAAHSPLFFVPRNASPTTPLRVVDGTVSIAAYGRLDRATRTLHLEVKLPAGAREPLEVLVPAGVEPFPSVRVEVRAPGGSWRLVRPLARPQPFYEPYGRQRYLRTHTGRIGAAAADAFLIRVTLPQRTSSRSVCVATGSREVFAGGSDLGRALERIRAWTGG